MYIAYKNVQSNSHQMVTLLIFDGVILENWLLFSLDFSIFLDFYLCLNR